MYKLPRERDLHRVPVLIQNIKPRVRHVSRRALRDRDFLRHEREARHLRGIKAFTLQTLLATAAHGEEHLAKANGFSLHAGVWAGANDRASWSAFAAI